MACFKNFYSSYSFHISELSNQKLKKSRCQNLHRLKVTWTDGALVPMGLGVGLHTGPGVTCLTPLPPLNPGNCLNIPNLPLPPPPLCLQWGSAQKPCLQPNLQQLGHLGSVIIRGSQAGNVQEMCLQKGQQLNGHNLGSGSGSGSGSSRQPATSPSLGKWVDTNNYYVFVIRFAIHSYQN